MKFQHFAAVVFLVTLILSCTKEEVKTYEQSVVNGIKITESSTTPADSTFKVVLKEVAFISNDDIVHPENCFQQANSMDFDDAGNLYVLDRRSFKIFKYDLSGNLLRAFGGQGQGPGEFIQPGTLTTRKDTVYVTDFQGFKIHKYDIEGDYISSKLFEDFDTFPQMLAKFGDNYISYGSVKVKQNRETGKSVHYQEVGYYDKNFNFIKNLHSIEYELVPADVEYDPFEKGLNGTASATDAYVYESSKTQYKIDVYDLSGKKVREIRRKYARVSTSEETRKKLQENGEKYGRKYKQDYLNSIYNLYTDKYNRLWVRSSTDKKEEGSYYDVFENDIFINRVKFDIDKDYSPRFVGDKIIGVNWENNSIKIYEY